MIKEFKTYLRKNETGATVVNVELTLTLLDATFASCGIDAIFHKVVEEVAKKVVEENGPTIQKQILNNKKFADAVYNAIVLKKAKDLI